MIEGIVLTSLKVIAVDKGRVFHALKKMTKVIRISVKLIFLKLNLTKLRHGKDIIL